MAGIVGYIGIKDSTFEDLSRLMTAMREEITYTGNERIDQWTNNESYGIVRVHHGIINAESQPIFNEDKSLCIVMNGDISGCGKEKQRLIQRGHRFRFTTDNDAEYCLHLYEEYGLESFAKLNGSFIIALYDLNSHELLLVNDRFSSRPLFYFHGKQQLIFGNQVRPLLKFPDLPRRLDLQAVFEFFAFTRLLGERTYYQDIKVSPPASILRFRNGRLSIDRYWQMRYGAPEIRSEKQYVEALADALCKAVVRITGGDHRLGVLLSGGLDSRVILAAANADNISSAFTIGDFLNQEVRIARKVADAKACKHIFLQRDWDHYLHLVDDAVAIGDGMYLFVHAHFLGFLSKIRHESDILLHGESPTAFFKGVNLPCLELKIAGKKASFPIISKLTAANIPQILLDKFKTSLVAQHPEAIFRDTLSNQFRNSINNSIKQILGNGANCSFDPYNVLDYFTAHSYFRHSAGLNWLCIRAYMDERTIIDNNVWNLYLSMPPQLRLSGRVYRKALKAISPDLAAIPDANTGLRADMPIFLESVLILSKKVLKNIHLLPKSQFRNPTYTNESWPDMRELIRYNENLKALIGETIHNPECIDPELFNVKIIDSVFQKHINREENFVELIFALFTFGRWYKNYGPKSH